MQNITGHEQHEEISARRTTRREVSPEHNMRRCIVSGDTALKQDMLRFVLSPDNIIVFDVLQKLPGRGLWVSADLANLTKAVEKNAFARAAKAKVTVPSDLITQTKTSLYQKLIENLCLSNRAGLLGAGADQCLDALRQNQGGIYVTASQSGSDTRERIESKNPDLPVIDYLSEEELGHIIGKPTLTHMIVKKGNLCLKGVHWHQLYQIFESKA